MTWIAAGQEDRRHDRANTEMIPTQIAWHGRGVLGVDVVEVGSRLRARVGRHDLVWCAGKVTERHQTLDEYYTTRGAIG